MHVLFAISILALIALLWATISIAQHIRRTGLRRRPGRIVDDTPPVTSSHSKEPNNED